MATFNKRGYKTPKSKETQEVDNNEEAFVDGESTTQEVFNTLDEGASRTEEWIAKNQKIILILVAVIGLATAGYLLYDKFVVTPNEESAANDMFQAQDYFSEAANSEVASDSLYTLALNGGEGKFGFLKIIEKYDGTQAANLANYYAGISYLRTKKYKEAITHLEQFTSKDEVLNTVAIGSIGDAFSELQQNDQALVYYKKAIETTENEYIKPIYLFKAGQLALSLKDNKTALEYFTLISEQYSDSEEAKDIQTYIGLAE